MNEMMQYGVGWGLIIYFLKLGAMVTVFLVCCAVAYKNLSEMRKK